VKKLTKAQGESGKADMSGKWEVESGKRPRAFHLLPSTKRKRAGFTLIELLGVMAIIGILSAVLLPPLISKIEDANTTKEDANLEEIARALVAGIKASGRIPRPDVDPTASAGWAAMATNYSVLGTNELIRSIRNSANDCVRRYFLSPALTAFLSGNYSPPAGGWPTNNFTNGPLYLMLVSVSKDGLLFNTSCKTNANLPSNDVVWLQNWMKTNNSSGRVPVTNLNIVGNIAGSTDVWTNRGEFLHVKVVDLKQLFCRVELIDTACPPTATMTTVGANYLNGEQISFNVGPAVSRYPFVFTATVNGGTITWGAGALTGNPPLMLTKPFNPNPATSLDPGPNATRIYGASLGTLAEATLASTAAPQFQINQLAAQPFGANNTMVFYVLKGTSLSLLNNAGATLITLTVQGDSIFKYFNSTWSRVD